MERSPGCQQKIKAMLIRSFARHLSSTRQTRHLNARHQVRKKSGVAHMKSILSTAPTTSTSRAYTTTTLPNLCWPVPWGSPKPVTHSPQEVIVTEQGEPSGIRSEVVQPSAD